MLKKITRNLRYDWPMHFILLFTNWLPDNVVFLKLRGFLAKPFFGKCGNDLRLGRNLTFYNCKNIHIGDNVYIAKSNWFSAGGLIIIKNEVMFGPMCAISSGSHSLESNNLSFRYGKPINETIIINNGVWISANCSIISGVEIGSGALIGANAVVNTNVPSGVLYGGVPGKIIKKIK
jgi:acetyltransferase-like isoleucine patch superfamily enzyme